MPSADLGDDFTDAGGTFTMTPLDVLGLSLTSSQSSGLSSMETLCQNLLQGDLSNVEDLFRFVNTTAGEYASKRLDQSDAIRVLDDVLIEVTTAVKEGVIREMNDLKAYVMKVTRCKVSNRIKRRKIQINEGAGGVGVTRKQDSVERKKLELVARLLREMRPVDQEALERYYVHGHSSDRICREMRLTSTQFRILRTRAKSRLAEMVREKSGHSFMLGSSVHIGAMARMSGFHNGSRWR
jgi:DNA-directed RNA polymerase specialized sigma24 family protein